MSDIRITLRDQFKVKTGLDPTKDLAAYADWLELRIYQSPKENLVSSMEDSLKKAALALEEARFHVKRVFNDG